MSSDDALNLARKFANESSHRHGSVEWYAAFNAALAAIRETTELATKLVENPDRKGREWVKDSLW